MSSQSLDTVKAEYERGNLTFVKKIQALQDAGWKEIFRVKGDGDCFWRAFAFGGSGRRKLLARRNASCLTLILRCSNFG